MKLDRRLANPQNDYPVNLTVIAQRRSQVFLCVTSVPPVVKLHSKTAKRIVTSVCHWMSVEKQKRTGRSLARTG